MTGSSTHPTHANTGNQGLKRCGRCVMDESDPDISFDASGQCSHCSRYDRLYRSAVEHATAGSRLPEFQELVSRIQEAGRGRKYDCVVGVSGGVDSTYVLLKAVEAGLRPLAVHFDSGWNSEVAVHNIEQATSRLGVDLKTEVVNWVEMRDLQLSFFKAGVANCDIPTDHAFPAVALRSAVTYKLKYILSGGNLATESILPKAWGHNASDVRYLKAVHRSHGSVKLRTYPTLGVVKKDLWFRYVKGIRTERPLNFVPYVKKEAKREISDKLGWRDYGGKHYESIFTRYFQGYYLPTRFGYDKRLAHLSSLILAGQLERDEALHLVENEPPYAPDLRLRDGKFVAKKLGISYDELERLVRRPLSEMGTYATNDLAYQLAFALREMVFGR